MNVASPIVTPALKVAGRAFFQFSCPYVDAVWSRADDDADDAVFASSISGVFTKICGAPQLLQNGAASDTTAPQRWQVISTCFEGNPETASAAT
ncbi:MAG TPA: hypothetical protein VF493_20340 [Terriglobales bacterium]